MIWMCHVSPELDQHSLHSHISVPVCETGELGRVDDALVVYAGQVDFGDESYDRRLVGVGIAAVHFDGVDAVFVD